MGKEKELNDLLVQPFSIKSCECLTLKPVHFPTHKNEQTSHFTLQKYTFEVLKWYCVWFTESPQSTFSLMEVPQCCHGSQRPALQMLEDLDLNYLHNVVFLVTWGFEDCLVWSLKYSLINPALVELSHISSVSLWYLTVSKSQSKLSLLPLALT